MENHNFTYTVLMIVFADADTRIVKAMHRTTSKRKARTYRNIIDFIINERGEIEMLGKRYDPKDCLITIKRSEDIDDLPF